LPQNKDRKCNIEYVTRSLPRAIHAFLTLALYGGKWSFVHGEDYQYSVDRRWIGNQRGVKSEFPPETETHFVSLVTAILIELYIFIFNF
jgi:hypothetical protein